MLPMIVSRFAISALAVAFSVAPARAQTPISKGIIAAATITTYPPFEFKDQVFGKLTGFDIDIAEAVAAKLGAKISWTESSFAQLISFNEIKTRRVDMIISGIADTPERRESVSFVDYAYDPQMFFTLRAQAERIPNLDALCGKRVAVTRSGAVMMEGAVKMNEEVCAKSGKRAWS